MSQIDPETEDIATLDESTCQSTTNSTRTLCTPTINGIKDPNILKKRVVNDIKLMQ